MKTKFSKRLLACLLSAIMVIAMLPMSALAADGDVARIGDTTYDTLDDAIAAAADGATIELLGDATTNGMNLSKNLTIQAAAGLSEKPTITFSQYGIALLGKALTFKDCDVVMNGIGATPYVEWPWMAICASVNASLTLNNVNMTMDATGVSNSPHAIYFCNNNILNLENGTTLTIKNYPQDALEWDGGNGGYNVNITDSTFVSDHNRSGFTGTFYATITNSKVDVINSTGNGSNGSHFIIDNSTVNFNDNGSHGLSAGQLEIRNSTVIANNNNGMGITVNNDFIVENSDVTVTGNASNSSYGYAAVRLYNDFTFSVDKDSSLHINDNNNTGLYVRQGSLTVEDGADLEIMGNDVTHTLLDGYGGGVYVGYGDNYDPTVTLPADAKIYNNHSINGGDDIYVSQGVNGPSLTFGKVGSDWVLDDCDHMIDGWYDDAQGARWEAHAEDPAQNHIVLFDSFADTGLATVGGLTYLKAAHGADFKDKTSYPSLDKQVQDNDDQSWVKDSVGADAGETVNFQLTSNVPEDLINYLMPEDPDDPSIVTANALVPVEDRGSYNLTFHDVMDSNLTLNDDSFQVSIGDTILDPQYYTVSTPGGVHDDKTCTFEISMDLVDLYKKGIITKEDIANATSIVVTYNATLSGDVERGTYPNEAWVTYQGDGETSHDVVNVNTYAIQIFKYDQADNKGLEGAKFQLYQKNSDGSINEESVVELTSGADGYINVGGLDDGTYYLKETQAPNGYVCSEEELTIVIPEQANIENLVSVRFANSEIPHTGGMGTTLFTVGGIVIMAAAGVLLVFARKKKKA